MVRVASRLLAGGTVADAKAGNQEPQTVFAYWPCRQLEVLIAYFWSVCGLSLHIQVLS